MNQPFEDCGVCDGDGLIEDMSGVDEIIECPYCDGEGVVLDD